jgi:predicted dinucleotide-binding enzyme
MRIAIIGSGKIGSTAARLFVDAGHEVAVANSRGPDSLSELAAELGERAHAAAVEDAASFGELVLVAIPFGRYRELPAAQLAGRTVMDATNYYPQRDGHFAEIDDDSTTSTELLAAHLPGAHVVKAFNTLNWKVLLEQGDAAAGDQRIALFIAGDDQDGKDRVAALIEQIGFAPVDTGSLAAGGRRQQAGGPLFGKPTTARQARE